MDKLTHCREPLNILLETVKIQQLHFKDSTVHHKTLVHHKGNKSCYSQTRKGHIIFLNTLFKMQVQNSTVPRGRKLHVFFSCICNSRYGFLFLSSPCWSSQLCYILATQCFHWLKQHNFSHWSN